MIIIQLCTMIQLLFQLMIKKTVIPKDSNYRNIIGQIPRLSNGDVLRINKMYECEEQ